MIRNVLKGNLGVLRAEHTLLKEGFPSKPSGKWSCAKTTCKKSEISEADKDAALVRILRAQGGRCFRLEICLLSCYHPGGSFKSSWVKTLFVVFRQKLWSKMPKNPKIQKRYLAILEAGFENKIRYAPVFHRPQKASAQPDQQQKNTTTKRTEKNF